ncbi:transposase [Vibrio sp. B1ASS3]|uniref:transposase n=1 Tax=Vibrio sp. B1ASS3 TaxID=2751176 RepID=UPI001FC7CF54|nr:transposase [Vibrio sp. B1ASS3]
MTFWIDEETIAEWKQNRQGKRGRPRRFSDLAITTALMVKRVFSMPLRALQGFLDSVFKLANVPLVCPHYTCISRRAKEVEVSFKTKTEVRYNTSPLMPLVSSFMAKVNGRLRSMVLTGSVGFGVSRISQ